MWWVVFLVCMLGSASTFDTNQDNNTVTRDTFSLSRRREIPYDFDDRRRGETRAPHIHPVLTADPMLPRPHGDQYEECEIHLFNQAFNAYEDVPIEYINPKSCRHPLAKAMLDVVCHVSQGKQFDRTLQVMLGGVQLLTGTTAEPAVDVSPQWHVQTDVTHLATMLHEPHISGTVRLGTVVDSTYDGVPHCQGKILLFKKSKDTSLPDPGMDYVTSLGKGSLKTREDQITADVTVPQGLQYFGLEVQAQAQQGDEFWWSCVPSNVAVEFATCKHTSFRALKVTIGKYKVFMHPVYPVLYTGGVDPYLWFPISGIQTYNILPIRIDLTPYLSMLDTTQTIQVGMMGGGSGDKDGFNSHWNMEVAILARGDNAAYIDVVEHPLSNTRREEREEEGEHAMEVRNNRLLHWETQVGDTNKDSPRNSVDKKSTPGRTTIRTEYQCSWKSPDQQFSYQFHFLSTKIIEEHGSVFNANSQGWQSSSSVDDLYIESSLEITSDTTSTIFRYPFHNRQSYTPNNRGGAHSELVQTSYFNMSLIHENVRSYYSSNTFNQVESSNELVYDLASKSFTSKQNTISSQTYKFTDTEDNDWDKTVHCDQTGHESKQQRSNTLAWWVDPYFGRRFVH